MSKATEWSKKYQAAFGPLGHAPCLWVKGVGFQSPSSHRYVVTPDGDLEMGGWALPPSEARKLADWILDVFSSSRTSTSDTTSLT